MTPYKKNIQGYQQVQVGSASPEKLLLMVYDGALKYMKSAKMAKEKNDDAKSNMFILKAVDCLVELIATLNTEKAPEMSDNLYRLYMYSIEQLREYLRTGSNYYIDEAITMIGGLKSAWEEAFSTRETEALKKTG